MLLVALTLLLLGMRSLFVRAPRPLESMGLEPAAEHRPEVKP